jgi:hypothetical protein
VGLFPLRDGINGIRKGVFNVIFKGEVRDSEVIGSEGRWRKWDR